VIDPGFVATPLTAQNDFAMPALHHARSRRPLRNRATASPRDDFEIHFPKRFTRALKLLQPAAASAVLSR
jgi:hypothetical protein